MIPSSCQLFSLSSQWLSLSLTPFWLDITTVFYPNIPERNS